MPRALPSFKEQRKRRLANRNRLRRFVPERRYIDLGMIHLQYYHGSVASLGYERHRRTFRGRSQHNR
jgi:hypothetical protein